LESIRKDVFLLLVGYDEENIIPSVKSLINNKKKLHFFGPSTNPENFYSVSDVLCLPSYREGFGSSVIEASSCELPILCSNVYGLENSMIDGETGLKHQVGNIDSLLSKMLKLTDDDDLRKNLGFKGRKFVAKHFSSEIIAEKWLRFHSNILNN